MNAAYLMLTTAWLAGQTPPPPAAVPAAPVTAAPLAAAPVVSTATGACNSGCGGCATADACCDSGGGRPSLFGRLRAKFSRGGDCGCESTCSAPVVHQAAPCCAPAPTCAAPVSTGDCCDKPHGLLARLRARRNRGGDCGCDSGCGSTWGGATSGCCGNGVGGVITAPATGAPAEAIPAQPKPGEAPKKMPSTTPMTFGGAIHDVTPVVAPRLGVEQEGPKQPF